METSSESLFLSSSSVHFVENNDSSTSSNLGNHSTSTDCDADAVPDSEQSSAILIIPTDDKSIVSESNELLRVVHSNDENENQLLEKSNFQFSIKVKSHKPYARYPFYQTSLP